MRIRPVCARWKVTPSPSSRRWRWPSARRKSSAHVEHETRKSPDRPWPAADSRVSRRDAQMGDAEMVDPRRRRKLRCLEAENLQRRGWRCCRRLDLAPAGDEVRTLAGHRFLLLMKRSLVSSALKPSSSHDFNICSGSGAVTASLPAIWPCDIDGTGMQMELVCDRALPARGLRRRIWKSPTIGVPRLARMHANPGGCGRWTGFAATKQANSSPARSTTA